MEGLAEALSDSPWTAGLARRARLAALDWADVADGLAALADGADGAADDGLLADLLLRSEDLPHSRGVAASELPPLRNIPHCYLPVISGPFLPFWILSLMRVRLSQTSPTRSFVLVQIYAVSHRAIDLNRRKFVFKCRYAKTSLRIFCNKLANLQQTAV